MNDFTKEELKDIAGWLSEIHHDSFDDVGCMINKLQSMIDLYDAKVIKVWHCEKCGHVQ